MLMLSPALGSKRRAIIELCLPKVDVIDVHPEQLTVAAILEQDGYRPLVEALDHYTDSR